MTYTFLSFQAQTSNKEVEIEIENKNKKFNLLKIAMPAEVIIKLLNR